VISYLCLLPLARLLSATAVFGLTLTLGSFFGATLLLALPVLSLLDALLILHLLLVCIVGRRRSGCHGIPIR
jgi:hypothetical protein